MNLGVLLQEQAQFTDARTLFGAVVLGRTESLGVSNPQTLDALMNRATVLAQCGEKELAKQQLETVVEAYSAQLGPCHEDTLMAKFNMGIVMRELGQMEQATPVFASIATELAEKFGGDHPRVQLALNYAA